MSNENDKVNLSIIKNLEFMEKRAQLRAEQFPGPLVCNCCGAPKIDGKYTHDTECFYFGD
jgi:hypothetical protein